MWIIFYAKDIFLKEKLLNTKISLTELKKYFNYNARLCIYVSVGRINDSQSKAKSAVAPYPFYK